MNIHDLIERQLDQARQDQISYQAMLKKRLKQSGLNREKLNENLGKDFTRLSKRIVNNTLNMGIEWLLKGKE